jgi:hypothetical protein
MSVDANSGARISLHYFEDVLAVEFAAIAQRRKHRPNGLHKGRVTPNPPERPPVAAAHAMASAKTARSNRTRSPNPEALFAKVDAILAGRASGEPHPIARAEPSAVEEDKQRPMPVPCDATGLALSGGGVRSAALGLGVVQALYSVGVLGSFDYLSTVSGGGYIGGTLTAGLAQSGQSAAIQSPFGDGLEDGPAIGHLRDYSNYLLPRGRSGVRNWTDVAAILLRGLVGNCVPVLAVLLFLALATRLAFPTLGALEHGNYLASLAAGLTGHTWRPDLLFGAHPFGFTKLLWWLLAVLLILWALRRSIIPRARSGSDAESRALWITGTLAAIVAASAFLDLQPLAIHALATYLYPVTPGTSAPERLFVTLFTPFAGKARFGGVPLVAFATAISAFGNLLGAFLTASRNAKDWTTIGKRIAARAAIVIAAMVLPLALWAAYLYLSATIIAGSSPPAPAVPPGLIAAIAVLLALIVCAAILDGNAYSLHRFYRDRLSRAFLFFYAPEVHPGPRYLDALKLSDLKVSAGPYPILNSALNVQGSASANRRGRNADFFMFTPDFLGSDLTLYAPTKIDGDAHDAKNAGLELDLATAIAISGAAVSANMGASTVRLLSPTLALLNFRLGYWLRNPRDLAKESSAGSAFTKAWRFFFGKFYLLAEMLNLLDENSAKIYLTDGGHIENLGLYELLKRGCKLAVVVDAEADPTMSFGALQIVERYARIDFGVRIELPWEAIAATSLAFDARPDGSQRLAGPHCAVGRIFYPDGAVGVLLYVKASMTGDEKDYILDYKKRNPSFPHETTGDQFFSEEQFEAYRALGFHMVEHFFGQDDDFAYLAEGSGKYENRKDARAAIDAALPSFDRAGGRHSRLAQQAPPRGPS